VLSAFGIRSVLDLDPFVIAAHAEAKPLISETHSLSSKEEQLMQSHCPHCGWPDVEAYQVVSRRLTRDSALLSWTRCACGSLQMRQQPRGKEMVVLTRGRPTADMSGLHQ